MLWQELDVTFVEDSVAQYLFDPSHPSQASAHTQKASGQEDELHFSFMTGVSRKSDKSHSVNHGERDTSLKPQLLRGNALVGWRTKDIVVSVIPLCDRCLR